MRDPVTAYARSVVAGEIPSCKLVRLACERHMRDLEDEQWTWDVREVVHRIDFCRTLFHYKGAFRGRPFDPDPWQQFAIGSIFGWKRKDNGLRRYRRAMVKVPRKNGKTFMAAVVAVQMLIAGGQLEADGRFGAEGGAEVYFLATKEDQAKIGWNDAVKIVKRSPGYADRVKARVKELRYDREDATCRPLGSDSDTLDGLNPVCAVKDEFHRWKGRDLHDVIDSAYGAREQPLDFIITTEGTLRGDICDEVSDHAEKVLSGVLQDDAFFALLFVPDAEDAERPFDEDVWLKVNPGLGGAKSWEFMRDEARKAKQTPKKRADFLTKQLNIKVNSDRLWIDMDQWKACVGDGVTAEALRGRRCSGALDMARKNDMTAFCLTFGDEASGMDALWWYWLPGEGLEERCERDMVRYDEWVKAGWIRLTEGNNTDYRQIEADIVEIAQQYQVRNIAFDPKFANELALRLRDDHLLAVSEYPQSARFYTPAVVAMERLLEAGKFGHGGNPVAAWNASNVAIKEYPNGTVLPMKIQDRKRIDGIAALLMAVGWSVANKDEGASVYDDRGLIVV